AGAALADLAGGAVGVGLALLVAADVAVPAHRLIQRTDALAAARADVAAGAEAGLAALLARVGGAVAAGEELRLVRADVDGGADRARVAVEVVGRCARRRTRVDGGRARQQVEVHAGRDEQRRRRGDDGVRVVAE